MVVGFINANNCSSISFKLLEQLGPPPVLFAYFFIRQCFPLVFVFKSAHAYKK